MRRCLLLVLTLAAALAAVPSSASAIVGGSIAPQGRYPFMAQVLIETREGGALCGGTLVSPSWVLTAGHCVPSDTRRVAVVLGDTRLQLDGDGAVPVDRIRVHPGWERRERLGVDAALLHLSSPRTDIAPVALAETAAAGARTTAVGWGTGRRGRPASRLRQGTLTTRSTTICNRAARSVRGVAAGMLCAGKAGDGVGVCSGDSGGPLLRGRPGAFVQVGIVSAGPAVCGSAQIPDLFTKLGYDPTQAFIAPALTTSRMLPIA